MQPTYLVYLGLHNSVNFGYTAVIYSKHNQILCHQSRCDSAPLKLFRGSIAPYRISGCCLHSDLWLRHKMLQYIFTAVCRVALFCAEALPWTAVKGLCMCHIVVCVVTKLNRSSACCPNSSMLQLCLKDCIKKKILISTQHICSAMLHGCLKKNWVCSIVSEKCFGFIVHWISHHTCNFLYCH